MNYWMVKTEPSSYSWEDFQAKGEDVWDGVRNYQARNFLKAMQLGDPVLFYHSGKDKAIVGVAEVSEEAFPDPKDGDWVAVKLKVKQSLPQSVTLQAIKSKDKAKALKLFSNFQSQVMKASKKGSLKRTTVSRKVSRISKQISKL